MIFQHGLRELHGPQEPEAHRALYAHLRTQVRGAVQMIHLTRTDPARNMARFYTMALQPTLFGEWALLKEWGRIGSAGRLCLSAGSPPSRKAALAMAEHLKAKLSKGYEAV